MSTQLFLLSHLLGRSSRKAKIISNYTRMSVEHLFYAAKVNVVQAYYLYPRLGVSRPLRPLIKDVVGGGGGGFFPPPRIFSFLGGGEGHHGAAPPPPQKKNWLGGGGGGDFTLPMDNY